MSFIDTEAGGDYHTRVVSDGRANQSNPPTNAIDGQQARHYAGSGDDALLAALNLPGVARTPGGLGVLWIAFDREKRGFHDHLARTYVVRGGR